ncbi:VanZ family protein [Bacillus sp. EB01]|uniref:VanZ family protein n=1 Tax=Bacillus sp. EB01 TaxID=1347086 RepID=UPI0006947322|nr:VanZ family protein [Bacillus sp. EB01]
MLFRFAWAAFILMLTLVSDPAALINESRVHFNFIAGPDYIQLFDVPETFTSGYIQQKIGHILVFFMLLLVARIQMKSGQAVRFCLALAIITEFLQLYTGRSGRLLDIGYDAAGFIAGMLTVVIFPKGSMGQRGSAKQQKM